MGGEKWERDQLWVTDDVTFLAYANLKILGKTFCS